MSRASSPMDIPVTVGAYLPPAPATRRTAGGATIGVAGSRRPLWNLFSRVVAQLVRSDAVLRADQAPGTPAVNNPDTEALATALIGAIAQATRAERPQVDDVVRHANAHEFIARTRRLLLAELESLDGVEGGELVRLLRAIDAVDGAVAEDAAQKFVGRLHGPEATQLVVEVAHDMRSPLGSILFLAEHLRSGRSGALTPIQTRQLGLIYSAALGLSGIASDVMELARGGDRLAAHEPIPFSLRDIIDGTLDIVRPMAEEKGLSLSAAFPDADSRLGHPAALSRVLLNLVTNALKFTNAGSVEVIVEPTERTAMRFSVQDTGRGIPPHVLASLCDSFRRRADNGHVFSSAGLGLAMCHKLVTAMGGELEVDTELEKGTRFTFQLELPPASRM